MKRILIVGPAWVGDMMMAQSLFKLLKHETPETQIDVLASPWSKPLLSCMPEVSQSIVLPIKHGELNLSLRLQVSKHLKQFEYDQAIVLPNSWKSALIPYFAKIPVRSGWVGECRFVLLNDLRVLKKHQYPRMIERFAALAYSKEDLNNDVNVSSHIPMPKLQLDQATLDKAKIKFEVFEQTKPILALCPGAEFGSSKRWPETHYANIAEQKLQAGWEVWLFGSEKDKPVNDRIQALTQSRCRNFSGQTDLGEAIHLLSLASCVLSNDSGLMHIAAALEKPLIAIYGSTDPKFTPPLSNQKEILQLSLPCSPCFKRSCPLQHHDCMQKLSPTQVIQSLNKLEMQCEF